MADADLRPAAAMASRWRRRPVCRMDDGAVALVAVSATGATLETALRPPLGTRVTLTHPDAGTIVGRVCAIGRHGIGLTLAGDEQAMGFALAALASDMSVARR